MNIAWIFLSSFLSSFIYICTGFGVNCGTPSLFEQLSTSDNGLHIKIPDNYDNDNDDDDINKMHKKPVRIAMFGDQGYSHNARRVMEMIKDWDADFILHLGDFDYEDSPKKFNKQINRVFSKDYPYFGVIGNHDLPEWSTYQEKLMKRLKKSDFAKFCIGEYGVNMVCNFKGVVFVLSGVGTLGNDHSKFIEKAFRSNPSKWKICAWHKNQHDYQMGTKPDETGYEVYEVCRRHGAIIATGHEHSYARSHVMKNFAEHQVHSTISPLRIGPGKTFMFVAGTGGMNIRTMRPDAKNMEWWAAYGTYEYGMNFGAMLCTFHLDGLEDLAHCQFRDIDGKVWDDFAIIRDNEPLETNMEQFYSYPTFETQIDRESMIIGSILDGGDVALTSESPSNLRVQPSHDAQKTSQTTFLTFYGNFKREDIKSVNLQIFGKEAVGNAQFKISGVFQETGHLTNASLIWDTQTEDEDVNTRNEGLEKGEVWVSPDISALIRELSQSESGRELKLVIEATGTGKRIISGAKNKCLAPALFIQYNKILNN